MRNLKKFLALVLATLMIVSAMVATTVSAADADHSDAVELLNRIDVYRGYGNDVMGDEDLVTRWHMALFISRVTTGFTNDSAWNTTANDTPFTDVAAKHYLGSIASAYKAGIIEGVGNNKFDPDANIKYQDALTMVVRALGWTDLDYPLGYIAKAQALGLTDNLNELDNKLETAITRGQTAEIIANALWVEGKNGLVLAEDVLKLQIANVTVIATENETLGCDTLADKGEVILSNGVELDADLLLEEGETVNDLLGYAYKIATNNNWETLVTAYRCDSDVLYNYGTEKNDIRYVQQGTAPDIKIRTNMVKLDGKNYGWRSTYSGTYFEAYTASTLLTDTGTYYTYYYNTDGDIVDLNGEILLYNINGVYYKNITGNATTEVLREATAQEILNARQPLKTTSSSSAQTYSVFNTYTEITDVADLWNNKFCEMKVFDADNDGDWDYGILKPYEIGVYGTTTSTTETVMNFAKNSTSSTAGQVVVTIDGAKLPGYKDTTKYSAVLASGLTFVGGTPAVGDTIIYTYNEFTGVFEVIENHGTYKRGNATEINGRGSYVVIDGEKYFYNLTAANLKGWAADDINLNLINTVIVDKTYVIDYFATAGYLIETGKVNPYGYNNYVAFTTSDIVKVDAAGNLYVNALIDATGVKKEVKISDVMASDGKSFKVGLAMYDYLKNNGYVVADSYWVGSTATTITKDVIIAALRYAYGVAGEALLPTNIYAGKLNADGTYSLVAFTPNTSYDPITNKLDKDSVNIVDNKNAVTVTLNYGINNVPYVDPDKGVASGDSVIATAGKFDTTAESVYVFVGKDDIRIFKGVAPNGATINLTSDDTVLLNATSNCVFVVNANVAVDTLYTGWSVETTPVVNSDYVFYAIVKDTKASVTSADGNGNSTLTVTNLYNVLTGETVNVIVTAPHANNMAIYEAVNAKWVVNDASVNCANLILLSANEDRFELISDDYAEFSAYVAALWANKTTVYNNVALGNLDDKFSIEIDVNGDDYYDADAKVFKNTAENVDVPVQSYNLTVVWGYDGTVDTINGSVAHNFSNNVADSRYNTVLNAGEAAFIAIDSNGNATGYVFAIGMASNQ